MADRSSILVRDMIGLEPTQPERDCLQRLLKIARSEDLGDGDVTSTILPAGATARGRFVAREPLVLAGGAMLPEMAAAYDGGIVTAVHVPDGKSADAGDVLAEWAGPAGAILAAERVALNFLQRLSGIATTTRAYVDAAAETSAAIYDTRKTTPGWRELAKYAVRAGGGRNHRMGLYDAVLVKDNHLAILAAGGCDDPLAEVGRQIGRLRGALPAGAFIEIEVDTLDQLRRALVLDVDVILLDNMSPAEMSEAVGLRDAAGSAGRIALEASGGVTLASVRAVAETGVERIAIGALTHSATAVDIALDIETD